MGRTSTRRAAVRLTLAVLPYAQRARAFEEDTHYWLTLKLATVCGFDLNQARLIASADWAMDDDATKAEIDVAQVLIDKWPNGGLDDHQKGWLYPRVLSASNGPYMGGAVWRQGIQSKNTLP